jgi:hypothetical protein
MLTQTEIFSKFCKQIDETIFSDENVGSFVAFVVDQSFITDFCNTHSIRERDLMGSIRNNLYRRDLQSIKGILAIQLYAASKRANSDGVTEKNYRERLSQVLDWDIGELQSWMKDYQESSWESLYKWCDSNFFYITKCKRKSHAGKYVQYPVKQALRVFTDEDLKYIAACFVDKNLQPGEDIQERDFMKIVGDRYILSYIATNHGHEVIENSISTDEYRAQIFNFYLRWNGEFKRRYNTKRQSAATDINSYTLYLRDDYKCVDIRKRSLELIQSVDVRNDLHNLLKRYYVFKRSGMILFKKDDIYDNMWQETRFLEEGEEGIAICIVGECTHPIIRNSHLLLLENGKIRIYQIMDSLMTKDLYTPRRFYRLEGGLKIGKHIYIQGACPILKLEHPSEIWIDGELKNDKELKYTLNHLSRGIHTIKIPHFKKIEIDVQSLELKSHDWLADSNKWYYEKKQAIWDSGQYEKGNVGLDFAQISQDNSLISTPILRRWSEKLFIGKMNNNETNIAIKIIK